MEKSNFKNLFQANNLILIFIHLSSLKKNHYENVFVLSI